MPIHTLCIFCLAAPFNAGASQLSHSKHYTFDSFLWSFDFKVTAHIEPSGTVRLSIDDFQPSHVQAWASLAIQARITKIWKRSNSVIVYLAVSFQGIDNHFEEDLGSGKVTWGPATGVVTRRKWGGAITIRTNGAHLPENLNPGPPAEYTQTLPPQTPSPDNSGPCDLKNRMHTGPRAAREGLSPRAFLRFKQGKVLIKLVGCDHWVRARNGITLKIGDMVKTGADSRATLVLDYGSSFVKVKPNSILVIPFDNANNPRKISFLKAHPAIAGVASCKK